MPLVSKEAAPVLQGQAREQAELVQHALTHGDAVPVHSRAERFTSFEPEAFPTVTGREEEWRFTPIDRLRGALEAHPDDDRDGDPAASYDVQVPPGYLGEPLAPGQAPRGSALVPADRAAVAAWAGSPQARHVRIPAEEVVTEPLRILVEGRGADRRSNAHHVLEVGHHAKATVVLRHTGSGVHTGNLEVVVGDGADLTVLTVQEWDDDAVHVGQHDALVGRDATYRHIAVTLGGEIVRLSTNVRYAGPGGSAECFGVYFADSGQDFEHRLFVDHSTPRCRSNVEYKGALQGESAHTVWVGDVLIRAAAEGTDTYELNRNLILTDGARADSVPNLEIETGQIEGAGHASATGRFDDEQLFYLQSRGVPADEARRLVVRGFFADIVNRIGVPDIVERLMAAIDAELELSMVTGEAADPALRAVVEESTSPGEPAVVAGAPAEVSR